MPDYINPDTIDPNRSYAQQLLEQQGGYTSAGSAAASASPMGGGQMDLMAIFGQLMDILGPKRGVDPLSNLDPFRVSATRGFFSYPMGGQAGSIPTIPATFMMDTINNTPSNLPGGAGGKYDMSQLALQENDVYTVNSMMPFSEPIWGNKLLQPTDFHRMKKGGAVARRQERLEKRQQRLEDKGKTGGKRYDNIQRRLDDIAAGGLGKTGVGNAIVDVGGGIGEGLAAIAPILQFVPGIGQILSPLASVTGNALGKINDPRQALGQGKFGSGLGNVIGGGLFGLAKNQLSGSSNAGQQGAASPQGFDYGNQFQGSGSLLAPLMGFGSGFGSGFNPIQNVFGNMSGLSGIGGVNGALGQTPFGTGFGDPFGATPGIAGNMPGMGGGFDLSALLSGLQGMGLPKFKEGGKAKSKVSKKISKLVKEGKPQKQAVAIALDMQRRGKLQFGGFAKYPLGGLIPYNQEQELVPIQTEEGEIIVHPNLLITPVNARKKHRSMDDDEVTDILSSDSYILSNDPKMRIKKESTEDIIMGIKSEPYSEDEQGMQPITIEFEELFGKNKKLTPAELGMAIRDKFPIINKKRHLDFSDVFTEETNKRNLESRKPYLEVLMALNEFKKMGEDSPFKFKHGGPVKMKNLPKAEGGLDLSQILNLAGTALPFIQSFIGKGANNPGQGYVNAALPIDQAGFQANVNARDSALGQGIADYTGLGQNLNSLALGQFGAGLAGNLLQRTNLPRYNFDSVRARLNNFNTQTPRAFAEDLSRPTYDTRAILQELGPNRGGTALAALDANRVNTRNNAMINQFGQDRNLAYNVMQGLNQTDIGEQDRNIPLELQEIQAQNNQVAGSFNQFSDLFGALGNNQRELLPILTGLNLERANLVGQPGMRAAQNLLNAGQMQAVYGQGQNGQGGQQSNIVNQLFGPGGLFGGSGSGASGNNAGGGNMSILNNWQNIALPDQPFLPGSGLNYCYDKNGRLTRC